METKESEALAIRHESLAPSTFKEAVEFSERIAQSDLAPKDYRGKPANVLLAIQMGMELGLGPMAAIQNIAVINGRPSLWGDAMLAVVQASPNYEWHREWIDGDGEKMIAHCEVQRKGFPKPVEATFSVEDAKKAKLWGKDSPWSSYPKRMLQMRARAFALRDSFADALRGIFMAEEAQDIPPEKESKRKTTVINAEVVEQQKQLEKAKEEAEKQEDPKQEEKTESTNGDAAPVSRCTLKSAVRKNSKDGKKFLAVDTDAGRFYAWNETMFDTIEAVVGDKAILGYRSETLQGKEFRYITSIEMAQEPEQAELLPGEE